MTEIHLIDHKGDEWVIIWAHAPLCYLHAGELYWKAWWYAPTRPHELRHYDEVPIPIFTEWWPE